MRCSMGAIYDVVIDLRPEKSTFWQWIAVELAAVNRRILYIPEGMAHGFQTLTDQTEVQYQLSAFYHEGSARGWLVCGSSSDSYETASTYLMQLPFSIPVHLKVISDTLGLGF